MRLPADLLHAFNAASSAPPGRDTLRYSVEPITPSLYGGYDPSKPDTDAPLRLKALRGQLREWWRILAQSGDLDGQISDLSICSPGARQAVEDRVWGSLGRGQPVAGAVGLDLLTRQAPESKDCEAWIKTLARGPMQEAMIYALYNAMGNYHRDLTLGGSYTLLVHVDDADTYRAAVERTVAFWATFGGLGSRTRRGIGAVRVCRLDDNGQSCPPLTVFPDSLHFTDGVATFDCKALTALLRSTPAIMDDTSALAWGLGRLKFFRQGAGFGRNGPLGRSRYPEANRVRLAAGKEMYYKNPLDNKHNHNPEAPGAVNVDVALRAAFGHFSIRFADGQVPKGKGSKDTVGLDPKPRHLLPHGSDRLASSMILRPVDLGASATPRHVCVFAQFKAMAGPHIPRMRIRPAGETHLLPAWKSGWEPGHPGGCSGILPLEDAKCAKGVFPAPQDAAQAFMNFVCSDEVTP